MERQMVASSMVMMVLLASSMVPLDRKGGDAYGLREVPTPR